MPIGPGLDDGWVQVSEEWLVEHMTRRAVYRVDRGGWREQSEALAVVDVPIAREPVGPRPPVAPDERRRAIQAALRAWRDRQAARSAP
jgi:hypothetical protein